MPVVSIFKMMAKFCQTRIDQSFTDPDFKVTSPKVEMYRRVLVPHVEITVVV